MNARTKRRQRHAIRKGSHLVRRHFLKRNHRGFELTLYVTNRTYEVEIWRRVDETGELWEWLSRQPIDGPVDRRSLVRFLESDLERAQSESVISAGVDLYPA